MSNHNGPRGPRPQQQGPRPQQQGPRTPQRPPSQSRYRGYVRPDPEETRARAEARGSSSRYDGIFKAGIIPWRPREGSNLIRFLPATWAPEPGKEDKGLHFTYQAFVHEWVGPEQGSYLCLKQHQGKPCPACRDAVRHRAAGDEDEGRKIAWRDRRLCYILDRDGDDPTRPVLFNMSKTQDTDIAAIVYDRRSGDQLYIDDPYFGYDISFDRVGVGLKSRYSAYRVARDTSALSEDQRIQDQILDYITDNPIPDMLQFYAADYIEAALTIGGGETAAPRDTRGHDMLKSTRDSYEEGVQYQSNGTDDEPFPANDEDPWEGELPEEEVDTTPQPEPPRHGFKRPEEPPPQARPQSVPRAAMGRPAETRRPLK